MTQQQQSSGSLDLLKIGAQPGRASHAAALARATGAPHERARLLERGEQLAVLSRCLDRAHGGYGTCALVHGEAGIGKTSVVQAFLGSIDLAKMRVLVAGCEALLAPRPLGPLVDLADRFPPAVAHALHEGHLWSGLFPALLGWLRETPTVLVVEDMHWADAGTLDFVRYTGRRLRDANVLLLLTYRSDELDTDHPLRGMLGELPASATTRICLPPLSPQAVVALADLAQRPRSSLFETTGGNPFYVTEVLSSESPGVPASVSDAVLGRVAQLPAAGRAAVEHVSVFPNQVTKSLFGRVAPQLLEAVDGCVRQGMLVMRGDALAFRHELAREAVLGALLPHRRAALHAAAFHALHDDASADALARQVHHAEGAGLTAAIASLAPRAAAFAATSGAHREAARLYALALRHGGALAAAARADLLEAHGAACMLTNRHHEAIASRSEALQLRRELHDRRGEGRNLCALARLHTLIEGTLMAFGYARQAVAVLEQLPPDNQLAIAYSSLAHLHLVDDDISAAKHRGSQAVSLAESLDDAEALAHALNTVGMAYLRRDNDPAAWAMLDRSLQVALDHGLDADAARALNNQYIMALIHREFARAADFAERGIDFCEAHGIDIFSVRIRIRRAFANVQTGRWQDAERDLAQIDERHAPSAMERATCELVRHLLGVRRGQPQAQEQFAAAIETMERLGVRIWFTSIAAARAEAAWLRGDADVVAGLRPTLERTIEGGDPWLCGELAAWCARLAPPWPAPVVPVATPYALELAGHLRDAAAEWARLGCPYERAIVLAGGDEEDLREALATFEQLGATPAAERVRRRLRQLGASGVQRGPQPRTRDDPLGLTARERQVFDLLLQGLSNAAIAGRLFRSERTVEHHVAAVLAKTRANTRAELIAAFGGARFARH